MNYNTLNLKVKNSMFEKLIKNKKGTAEVIGTIMFIVILLFFFTNVYLWHDAASKDMNELYVKKMNAGMSISFDSAKNQVVVNATSSTITLSRLWIDSSIAHVYADLTSNNVQVTPGGEHSLTIMFTSGQPQSDGSVQYEYDLQSNLLTIHYYVPQNPHFTIVNTLGVAVST